MLHHHGDKAIAAAEVALHRRERRIGPDRDRAKGDGLDSFCIRQVDSDPEHRRRQLIARCRADRCVQSALIAATSICPALA